MAEFRQLRQFLEVQEKLLLSRMEEVEKEIVSKRENYMAKITKELHCLENLIREAEEKCQQPTFRFLQVSRQQEQPRLFGAKPAPEACLLPTRSDPLAAVRVTGNWGHYSRQFINLGKTSDRLLVTTECERTSWPPSLAPRFPLEAGLTVYVEG